MIQKTTRSHTSTTLQLFSTGVFLLIYTISIGQISPKDWKLNRTLNRGEINNSSTNKLPVQYLSADISVSQFYSKIKKAKQSIWLPTPDEDFEEFIIKPTTVIDQSMAQFYTIKTFTGYKADDPSILIACDIDLNGFHAAIYTPNNTYFIEPLSNKKSQKHIVFYKKYMTNSHVNCETIAHEAAEKVVRRETQTQATNTKRTYRLAMVASGEYAQQFGGTPYNPTNVLNALASGVNLINPIWLRDLGIDFTLVTTPSLIFENPDTDPFETDNKGSLLSVCHQYCVNELGNNGFDVGHLAIWGNLGGTAFLGVACKTNSKGGAYSSANSSVTTLWVDYISHELGHQFGSEHNFSAQECGTSASNFRYEPGEGSSIMSYANTCNKEVRYASSSDPYFHYASITQIQNYIFLNGTCATTTNSGNSSDPVVNAKKDITIPKQTPFVLVGSASDANDPSTQLSYNWLQYDGNGPETTGTPDCSAISSPLFKYIPPVNANFRSFPNEKEVLAGKNNTVTWEKLPCRANDINFLLAVRDNNSSFGRVKDDRMVVTVADTGPFEVVSPNGGEITMANNILNVTWNVNGTNTHCAKIDILLSTDGGSSYSVIVDGTTNDGSENILLPSTITTEARILLQCDIDGIFKDASTFYDVSNANFTIEENLGVTYFKDSTLYVYPNPANEFITVEFDKPERLSVLLVSVNLNGGYLLKRDFIQKGTLDIRNLSPGIYFLEIQHKNSGNKVIKKIIKK